MIAALRYTTYEAENCLQALEIYRSRRPSIIFVDLCMPDMNGVEFTKIISSDDPGPLVAAVTGNPDEGVVLQCIRAGASEFLKKPIEMEELKQSLDRLAHLVRRRREKYFKRSSLVSASIELNLATRSFALGPAVSLILSSLRSFTDPQQLLRLELAIDEALRNAYEHGNLEIAEMEKTSLCENDSLEERLREKENDPLFANRTIKVLASFTADRFVLSIEDEGRGFNWQKANGQSELSSLHGRGLALIRTVFDSVQFNEKGNKISLVKDLSR